MNDDAISAAARDVMITDYLDLKVQLEKGTGTRPMLWLLADARNKAVIAIRKMIEVEITVDQIDVLRALQADVRLYGDMMESAERMLARGKEADRELHEQDREAISDMLTPEEAREAGVNQAEDY